MSSSNLIQKIMNANLIPQIAVGIVLGILLVQVSIDLATSSMIFGELFVGALKAVRASPHKPRATLRSRHRQTDGQSAAALDLTASHGPPVEAIVAGQRA